MKSKSRIVAKAVFAIALLQIAVACSESPATQYYTLTPIATSGPGDTDANDLVIAVGPITIPQYLDRTGVVIRASGTRVVIKEFHAWSEPLADMIPRVLAENIGALLKTTNVFILPQRRRRMVDFQAEVDFVRFDIGSNGEAEMIARWSVYAPKEDEPLRAGRLLVRRAVNGDNTDAEVQALSEVLGELSRQITQAIREIRPL